MNPNDSGELEFAIRDVVQAFKQLEFALKLTCYCARGDLDRDKFDSNVEIWEEEKNVVLLPAGLFPTDQEILVVSQINEIICLGVSAIVLDAAFETAGIKTNPEANHPDNVLRTLVYMVRCAFAHNFANPCWEARGKYARKIKLDLDSKSLCMDLGALNGKVFNFNDFGGLANWYKIKEMAVQMIQDKLKSEE